MRITIKKNPNGDTRTAPKDVTFEQFQEANDMHREDVRKLMKEFASRLYIQGVEHDWTKKEKEQQFFNDFLNTKNNGADFVSADWYQYHIHTEKHHPLSYCHDDITLLDIIEMIADCTCAGLARSGEIRDLEISDEILHKAVNNTILMLREMLDVEE